ncbi:unnamed protein product [Danaus chrysippus]|uniref:(African queen) hypothetical protein n=1 Tax=Danaus chrysippus TaxID=151541 RepID=A0A8J2R0D4_9NEOP|nr:unnamed protein product [Danaus chrysippus]
MYFCSDLDKRRLRRALTDNRLVITQHFTERTVTPGGDISMQCAATGDKPPQFVWERDGVTVSSNTDPRYALGQIMTTDNSVIAQLNITRVRVEDGGLYACIAKEGEHVASSENRLDVYGPPYIRSLPPIKAQSGESINLRCPFYGYPIRSIDNSCEVNKEDNGAVYTCIVTSPSGEMARRSFEIQVIEAPILEDLLLVERSSELFSALVIKKVALEHCGTYTCVASNHVAKVNKSTQLYIKVAPKWLEEPSNSSLLLGRKGIVSCSASGYPQPQVHWMKKDALLGTWQPVLELAGGGILSLPNGSLVIEEVSLTDEGLYSCNVENGVGTPLSKTVWMTVNTYSLTWKEASGPWQEVWSPNKVPNKLSNLSGVQKHALTGLKCGTKYSLRITATNKVGTSQPAYLDVSTLAGPPIAPTSTEWFWSNCSHVFIQAAGWDDAGCELRTLELEHRALGARSWMRPINILVMFPRQSYTGHLYQYRGSFALSGLSAGTWYVLRITATNEAGSVTTVYNYATKNEDGSEVGPPSEIFDINMLVIVLSSILLAVCLICCVYILVKRQRNVNLTGYRDLITVDKSESGNITANTSQSNLANVKENSMNAQNRIYSAPIHVRNNSKHELYEISPYAQFAVGFRTFGHAENSDVPRHIKYTDTGSEDNETR